MLRVLVEDTAEAPTGSTLTPCLEYIIQEKILVLLVSFAWSDRPLGIRQYVYMFLSKVLQHLHHSYLHQMKIHKPLQAMIKATCEKKASPYENQEIEFLSIVCEKIREDVTIILLYIEPLTLTGDSSPGFTPDLSGASTPRQNRLSLSEDAASTSSDTSTMTPTPDDEAKPTKIGSKFPLVEALLNLCHSSDNHISAQAHSCLLTLTSLQEARSSEAVAKHTLLSHYIASRLITTAEIIPLDTEPSLVEDILLEEKERIELSSSDSEGEDEFIGDFPGKREVTEHLRWLVLFDKLIGGCDSHLGSSICSIIRELFYEGFMSSFYLSHDDDDVLSLFTALITKMLLVISSTLLSNSLISWLIDDVEESENDESPRKILLRRCICSSHHLQIQSLRLLQVMLEKPGSLAVQVLALNYVCTRGYFDSSAAEHQQNSWSDEEDERYKQREEEISTPGSLPISRTLAPSNINKIVKKFLCLVPEEVRSTSNEDFDSYKMDALRLYRDVCRRTPYHTWPREAVSMESSSDASSTASKESKAEAEGSCGFVEGPFLSMILDFLQELPEQDYDVNLQVTSLVSSLALLPHPHLHEFLLNPTISLNSGVRTPYTVLSSVLSRIYDPIVSREDFRNYLKVTRFQLLGTMEHLEYERNDDDLKFEALIVLEEFIKELAAIAYAKYTCEGNLP
ncbi:hypothetical protein Anas_09440 [Armadillidium nasatum]|uniref:FHF complex subunit HOOK-interacting protein C-terminal domain-containing protein n=1 Tax=Armadillidium nasatum TaxID=96803 RepID=A0A5N5SUD4_9CRUS|nr:hypothetical protein Anas_09440 [Armadillidium nasatum]